MKTLMLTSGLIISSLLNSCSRYDGHMGGYGHMMNYSYGGIFMWITIVLVVGIIGFGVYYFLNKKGNILNNETALDILKKRYAKGEITTDDFEDMKNNL